MDQHPLAALRIFRFQVLHAHALVRARLCGQQGDRLRLVVLDRDDALRLGEQPQHHVQPCEQPLRLLQHQAQVAGQIRLALRTVYNKEIGLFFFGVKAEFQRGRKACAAKTYGTAVSYCL